VAQKFASRLALASKGSLSFDEKWGLVRAETSKNIQGGSWIFDEKIDRPYRQLKY